MPQPTPSARRWFVSGRVQGVGFRSFAAQTANLLGLTGYARNLDDGRVEVYAAGPNGKLDEFSARLREGPRWADVQGFEEQEAVPERRESFESW